MPTKSRQQNNFAERGWYNRFVRGLGARGPKFDLPDLTSEFLSALCSLSRFNTRQTEHWWRGGSKMSAPSTSGLSVDTVTSYSH